MLPWGKLMEMADVEALVALLVQLRQTLHLRITGAPFRDTANPAVFQSVKPVLVMSRSRCRRN